MQVLLKLSTSDCGRVSVQGVKSLGGHFACLCRGFEFYEVKKNMLIFFKKKMEIFLQVKAQTEHENDELCSNCELYNNFCLTLFLLNRSGHVI